MITKSPDCLKTQKTISSLLNMVSGVQPIRHNSSFPEMPENILRESKISLWNFCLEIHTGRIFENLTGSFYILIVPLTGIAGITVVIQRIYSMEKKIQETGIQ